MSTNMLVLRRNTDKHFAFDRFSNNTGTLRKIFEYETTDKDFAPIPKVKSLERLVLNIARYVVILLIIVIRERNSLLTKSRLIIDLYEL